MNKNRIHGTDFWISSVTRLMSPPNLNVWRPEIQVRRVGKLIPAFIRERLPVKKVSVFRIQNRRLWKRSVNDRRVPSSVRREAVPNRIVIRNHDRIENGTHSEYLTTMVDCNLPLIESTSTKSSPQVRPSACNDRLSLNTIGRLPTHPVVADTQSVSVID